MAQPSQALVPRYQFGVFTVDVRACELLKQGTRVKLQERPFQLLVALLERPGEVVTREELRQRLWPDGTFVDFDHNISSAINKLRGALHDSARHPRYVETVGRRGYRFVYPVTVTLTTSPGPPAAAPAQQVAPPGPLAASASRRLMVPVLLAALLLLAAGIVIALRRLVPAAHDSRIRSIAVLPLKNLSSDPEQEYFSEGLTDELITRLASLPGLRVISRTSVMQYKDSRKPLPVIARELNVDAIVEGTVLRAGERVRITAQLIASADDRHLWAESYERDQRDILALQNEVTRDIAENIQLSLNPAERQRLAASRPVDPQAHDDYLRGRYHWSKRSSEELKLAMGFFQQAIARQPDYARAYAGLADCYTLMSAYGVTSQDDVIPKARAAALKALELDAQLAEAHTSLALIAQNYDWDWQTAGKEYRQAIELDANYATAHHWYAEHLALQGRFDEALAEMERARQLDPHSLIIAADKGAFLYFARQYDRAIEQFRAVLATDPSFPRADMIVGVYVQQGRFADARAALADWRRVEKSDWSPWLWANESYVEGRAGQHERAERALQKLRQMNRQRAMDPLPMVSAYLGLDDRNQAMAWLQKAYEEHSPGLTALKVDPVYDPLRNDPRFQELLRRVRLAQ